MAVVYRHIKLGLVHIMRRLKLLEAILLGWKKVMKPDTPLNVCKESMKSKRNQIVSEGFVMKWFALSMLLLFGRIIAMDEYLVIVDLQEDVRSMHITNISKQENSQVTSYIGKFDHDSEVDVQRGSGNLPQYYGSIRYRKLNAITSLDIDKARILFARMQQLYETQQKSINK